MAKKSYILDTSVYLTDYHSFLKYGNNDIVVPLKVLDEIDKHKKRLDMVGANARSFIRVLDKYIKSNRDLFRGVRMEKGRGLLTVKKYGSSYSWFKYRSLFKISLPSIVITV